MGTSTPTAPTVKSVPRENPYIIDKGPNYALRGKLILVSFAFSFKEIPKIYVLHIRILRTVLVATAYKFKFGKLEK